MMKNRKTLVVVVGPTAVGKTAAAIKLAQYFDTEILSADSRQFYREMNVGTAKPDEIELLAAKHHFINSHLIKEDYSAGDFERDALHLLGSLFEDKDVVIMVGGSGLFVRAVCEGLDDLPKAPEGVRDALNKEFEAVGLEPLKERLRAIDPGYYAIADIDNPQRVIRALEVFEASGNTMTFYQKRDVEKRPFDVITIGLNTDREILYNRINLRVDKMIQAGLVEEVKALDVYRTKPAMLTVGYSEIFQYLDGAISLEEAIDKVKQNSRRYAKRQITWFKKYGNTIWFEPTDEKSIITFLEDKLV